MKRVRTAIIGAGDAAWEFADAVRADPRFALVALGAEDSPSVRRAAEALVVPAYDDCRSLIVESSGAGLDLLIMAAGPVAAEEYAPVAAERGVPTLVATPPAQNLEGFRRVERVFQAAAVPVWVSQSWRYDPAFEVLHRRAEQIGVCFGASVCVTVAACDAPDAVRNDLRMLLFQAYDALGVVLDVLGLPEEVVTVTASATQRSVLAPAGGGDFAAIVLRFAEARAAGVTLLCQGERSGWSVELFGAEGAIALHADRLLVSDRAGRLRTREVSRAGNRHAGELRFVADHMNTDAPRAEEPLLVHEAVLAVMEASCLSARTGAPELPARLT